MAFLTLCGMGLPFPGKNWHERRLWVIMVTDGVGGKYETQCYNHQLAALGLRLWLAV